MQQSHRPLHRTTPFKLYGCQLLARGMGWSFPDRPDLKTPALGRFLDGGTRLGHHLRPLQTGLINVEILHQLFHHGDFVIVTFDFVPEVLRLDDQLEVVGALFFAKLPGMVAGKDREVNPDSDCREADRAFFSWRHWRIIIAALLFRAASSPAETRLRSPRLDWFLPSGFHRRSGRAQVLRAVLPGFPARSSGGSPSVGLASAFFCEL